MYSLLHHNTFGLDAWCRDFREYKSVEELTELLPELTGTRWFHIGGGSNLIFVRDYDGLILHSRITDCEVVRTTDEHVFLRVGSGYVWDDLVAYCVEHGYYGLENLSLIPGEVGSSAVQNIGAYGVEVHQFFDEIEAIDAATGERRVFAPSECEYAYRSSIFKHALRGKYIITHITFRLNRTFALNLEYGALSRELEARGITPERITAASLREIIIDIRHAKLPDPDDMGNVGSFFMNPVVSEEKFNELYARYPEMPHYNAPGGVKIPAGWMIEQCGWKGQSLGPVGVYPKQALVLINLGGATGEDVVKLSDAIREDVKAKFGVDIFPEANFIE